MLRGRSLVWEADSGEGMPVRTFVLMLPQVAPESNRLALAVAFDQKNSLHLIAIEPLGRATNPDRYIGGAHGEKVAAQDGAIAQLKSIVGRST